MTRLFLTPASVVNVAPSVCATSASLADVSAQAQILAVGPALEPVPATAVACKSERRIVAAFPCVISNTNVARIAFLSDTYALVRPAASAAGFNTCTEGTCTGRLRAFHDIAQVLRRKSEGCGPTVRPARDGLPRLQRHPRCEGVGAVLGRERRVPER